MSYVITIEPVDDGWTVDFYASDPSYRHTSFVRTQEELRAAIEGMVRDVVLRVQTPAQKAAPDAE